jgi:4-hydroxybenzoate polyprenyltransferase
MNNSASDITRGNWIDRFVPYPVRPYLRLARLDRPIGTWLLLLPCWWSMALANIGGATGTLPEPRLMGLFAIGALVMRGAGCTLNDIVDREYDGKVARTATRPIPSGDVSVKQAIAFLVLQLLIGLVVLCQLNGFAIALGVSSLALVAVYPFAKRFTYWPQLVLGLTFNWGALLGWVAVRGSLDWPAVAIYAAGVFWTLGYDTIYAHQDKEDDILIGVKSTALKFGDSTRGWLILFYAATATLIGYGVFLTNPAFPFYGIGLLGVMHLVWQIVSIDIDDPVKCMTIFKSNRDFGLILFIAIVFASMPV